MSLCKTAITVALLGLFFSGMFFAQRTGSAQPPGAGQPATPASADKIAAVVNGQNIKDAELMALINRQLRGQQVSADVINRLRAIILESLINGRLVEQFLAEKKIEAPAEQVETTIQDIKQRVATAGLQFEQLLQAQGQTEATLRQRIAADLAFEQYAKSDLTDEKLQAYFDAHQVEYDGSEVRASHVLIRLDPDASDEERKAAVEKIQAIRTEIVNGMDFSEAAKRHSEGPSGPNGGDLGFFPRRDRMVEPFAAAAFALEGDNVSEPVETQFGLHLIKVTERKAGDKTLTDVRDTLQSVLSQQLREEIATQQRKQAKIEIPKP